MITGRVNWLLEATASLDVRDAFGNLHRFQCIVDTAFDGDISLPPGAIRRLGLISSGPRYIILGNDDRVEMETFYAPLIWHGEEKTVSVLQADGEPALGTALLENSTLIVEVWDGGDVLIEPRQ